MNVKQRSILTVEAVIGIAIISSIALAMSGYSEQFKQLASTDWKLLTCGILTCLAYRIANANGWSYVLESIGDPLPRWTALRIWLTSEACRWLPGSVWSYGSRAMQARKHGVSAVAAASSLLLEMLLTILAWSTTAAITLVFYHDSFITLIELVHVKLIAIVCATAVVGGGAIFIFVRRQFANTGFVSRKLSVLQSQIEALRKTDLNFTKVAVAYFYFLTLCFLNGVAAFFVLDAVLPDLNVPILAIIGANAAAWLVGFFAVLAPGGLIVREGTMASLLVAWLPIDQAIGAAVIWRLIQVLVEIACMVPAYIPNVNERLIAKRLDAAERRLPSSKSIKQIAPA